MTNCATQSSFSCYILLVIVSLTLTGCLQPKEIDLLVSRVEIVDILTGETKKNQSIRISGDTIVGVGPSTDDRQFRPQKVLDGHGRFAIPGLWDMHVHALWDSTVATSFLAEFSRNGITGIRDMGGVLNVLHEVRSAPESQSWRWPRIFAAGLILDGPEPVDPSISIAVSNPQEGRAAVDSLFVSGADFIKVYTLLPRDAFFAVIDRATDLGLLVTGHVPADVSVEEAIDAGMQSIEHLRDEIEPFCWKISATQCGFLIRKFAEKRVFNTPTLVVQEAKSTPGYIKDGVSQELQRQPGLVQEFWNSAAANQRSRSPAYFAHRDTIFTHEMKTTGRLQMGEAPILAGSDTGNPYIFPGSSLHRELELLVDAGLTPRQALYSATIAPATFFGFENTNGQLNPGFDSDIVLLNGNPLEDISYVRQVSEVILRGKPLGQPNRNESQ